MLMRQQQKIMRKSAALQPEMEQLHGYVLF